MKLKQLLILFLVFSLAMGVAAPPMTSGSPGIALAQDESLAGTTDPTAEVASSPESIDVAITSTYAATPPIIDGKLDFGEWNYSNRITFPNGFISVVNDGMRLYVLLDVLGDTTDDTTGDYFWLVFDVDRDGVIDANKDLLYGLASNGNMRYSYYLGPNTWTGLQPNTYSSRGKGFGCFWSDGTFSLLSIFPFRFSCSRHRVWELAIDLAEIGSTAPGAAHMGVRVASSTPSFINEVPANIGSDFSNLIQVSLAAPPTAIGLPPAGAGVAFDAKPIEITQAVQDRDNTVPLVSDKTTAARVYIRTTGTATPQNTKAYLYGSVGGVDLPGSPLAVLYKAPLAINRNQLSNTANFQLPSSWDQGSVLFSAKAANFGVAAASSTSQTLAFTQKRNPTYWVVPLNTGTAGSPVLISQNEIDSQVSYLRTVFPANFNIIQKPWTAVGVTTVPNSIQDLNDYYTSSLLSWFFTILFTGKPPFTLPDQIYGFTSSGGGISDPTWIGAAGRVGRGFRGSSREGTFAHEINHNLDRSLDGTWGRHVNPGGTGCGAAGPDPSWPFTDANIHEVGFDTRPPWSASGSTLTVIPATTPDLMSYCQSGLVSPTKWISVYRWQNIFNSFTTIAGVPLLEDTVQAEQVLYLSGSISRDPESGELFPVWNQPGEPTQLLPEFSDYSIEIQEPGGQPISTTFLKVEFLDDPEEPFNTVFFNLQIPHPAWQTRQGIGKIVLKHGDAVLDEIVVSNNPPTVSFVEPSGGEQWNGIQTIQWTASDPDGDPLTFTLLYSPEGGMNWFPVASGVEGTSLLVDMSTLPGGSTATFRIIASDGFNNGEDISNPFTVANNPPQALIISPPDGSVIPADTLVPLTADANDPEDGFIPDESFVWTEGDEVLGFGREAFANLSPGLHTITLSVADSSGNTTQVSVDVFIGSRVYLPVINRQ
jgi:hypothetical protein